MEQTVVQIQEKVEAMPDKAQQPLNRNIVADVYLKTNIGVVILMGKDGNDIRQKIEQDKEHILDYTFYDDDNKRWAYWAIGNGGGTIRPLTFPDPVEFSLTSQQLYTKAVSYVHILAHAVGLLKDKPPTLWDKMLKPTTIIIAIVGIIFVMGLMLMALTG